MMIDTENPVEVFTALDRCDRCGAQAFTRAVKGASDLQFCGHHARKHIDALYETGWQMVHDSAGYADIGYDVPEPQLV